MRFLLPRSGLMTLDVGFNPRSAGYVDRPVASATIGSGVRLIRLAGSTVANAMGELHLHYRGLKPTAQFILSLCDRKTTKDLGNDKPLGVGSVKE